MVAEVDAMFSVNEVPWHGLGKILDKPPTTEDAIVMAGLNWDVETAPLYVVDLGPNSRSQDLPGWVAEDHLTEAPAVAIRRVDNEKILGVVGTGYRPLQNKSAFKFFDPFIEQGVVTLETAGSLKGGKRVWVLGRVQNGHGSAEIVKGDEVKRYVLLANSHDGTMAIRTGFTCVRVVCNNTLQYAVNSRASKLLRVRHTENAEAALEKIRETMDLANQEFVASCEQMRSLARKGVVTEDIKEYIRLVFQPKVVLPKEGEEVEEPCKRIIENIIPLFEAENDRMPDPNAKGTYWAAYNGITAYLSHERGRTQDNRVDSLWFGDSAQIAQRALDTAVKLARVA